MQSCSGQNVVIFKSCMLVVVGGAFLIILSKWGVTLTVHMLKSMPALKYVW